MAVKLFLFAKNQNKKNSLLDFSSYESFKPVLFIATELFASA